MATPHELAKQLKELDDQLVGCMRCGMCQAVCPVYSVTGREADVARGKLALLDGMLSEMIENPEAAKERLDRCLLCGSCEANCPSGVKATDIFIKGRAIVTGYLGLSPIKKVIFQNLMTKPKLFNALVNFGSKFQGLFAKSVSDKLGASCARIPFGPMADRNFKSLASKPFHADVPSLSEKPASGGVRVAIFVGCAIDKMYPEIGHATLKILRKFGCGIEIPADQACCGIPSLSSGESGAYREMLAHNLKRYDPSSFDYLITACATCASVIKDVWPHMPTSPSDLPKIKAIAEKTMDITSFLSDVLKIQDTLSAGQAGSVTYHDPCHLRNALKVTAQPRSLLQALPGADYREMTDAQSCCGCGGSFTLFHYGISTQLGLAKAEKALATGASTVTTACPACMMQLTDMLAKKKADCRVRHVAELVAEAL